MAEDLVGRQLRGGEYELREVLGRGGMATVYRAYARSLDTDVAVKILSPRLAGSSLFRARFRDEARSLAQLHHPNLVEVHHYGEEGDLVYIVMRLVAGGTLKDRLAALDGPLDLVSTARLIGQVADALQAAHERGLVHLDIKPANILLGRADWPLLADFGITRAIGRERSASGQERYAGTPLYMSPEQCRGDPLDGRSDEYSLAVTTYELLVGARPFSGATTEAVLDAQLNLPPPPPRARNPGIPGPVEAVILRGLAKQPDERYPSVAEYARALREAVEQTRGVALETKQAAAEAAPNLVGALGLVLLGPLLLGLLPAGPLPGSRIPPGWIVQTVLALLIGALYLGVRWHLIGLTERALAGLLGGVLGPTDGPGTAWRRGLIGAVEGLVNLGYLFGLTWLISRPALALLGAATTPAIAASAGTALTLAVIIAALALIVRLYRTSGPGAAALVLGVAWVMAAALPGGDVRPGVGPGAAWIARALGAAGVLALALAARPRTRAAFQQILGRAAGPILAALHPAEGPGEAAAGRAWLQGLIGDVLDFGYLLLGYGLLHQPANDLLGLALGPLPAAILVTGLAGLPWLILTIRLGRVAGRLGAALGILLGAPLLLTLPILDAGLLGARWPVTIATWGVGTTAVLLLVLARGQVQDLGRRALGPVLERRVLGTVTAASEEEGASWLSTVGGLVGAALDAALLVLVYWLLGVPAAAALDRTRQDTAGSEIILLLFLAGIIAILARPLWNLLALLAGVRGRAGRPGRAWPVLATALVALLATSCAATPVILAAPASVGALAPEAALAGRDVVVTWQYWQPAVPSPDQATYNLALSCSDGEPLGWFREAVRPAPGRPMPAGPAGATGRSVTPCDNWQQAYLGIRRAAGLPRTPSFSWGWLDIQIQIGPDGSAAVTETHHLLVTSGELDHLTWELDGQPTGLTIQDAEGVIPFAAAGSGPRRAQLTPAGARTRLEVWFPPLEAPATSTLAVTYRLDGALQTVGGVRRFERVILEPERDGPVWRTTIRVTLPPSLATGPLRPGTRGWPARSGLLDGRTAWFEADDVSDAGGFAVSLEIGGPTSTPSPVPASSTPTPTGTPTATDTAVPTATPSPTATVMLRAALPASPVPATTTPPPTPTPRRTPTPSPTRRPSPTPSRTATPSPTQLPSPTATSTATAAPPPAAAGPHCAGDERMTFAPTNPVVGQTLTITVTSATNLQNVLFQGPDSPRGPTVRQDSGGYHWDWQVVPSSPGRKDYYFFVGNFGTLCTTNSVIVAPAPTATPTPTLTPTITPTATATVTPTMTPTPTPVPPPLSNPRLSVPPTVTPNPTTFAVIVPVSWGSSGGVPPYQVVITARYFDLTPTPGAPTLTPYATYVSGLQTGSLNDAPPTPFGSGFCSGSLGVQYQMSTVDGNGQSVGAVATTYCSPGS